MTAHFGEIDADVRDLSALLGQAGIQPPYVLAGHGAGALLVREYRRQHADEVAGMILIDARYEEESRRISAESHDLAPLLDMSEKNLRASLTISPVAAFTPDSPAAPESSLASLPPDLRAAHSWAHERWKATLARLTRVQWAGIMESSRVTYSELYKGRFGSEFPLADLPLAVVTSPGDAGAGADYAFARSSRNGTHILASRGGGQTPLELPGLVSGAILDLVEVVQARLKR
jgi:pimeloyl-ACP methyl ester carboxylesterase